MQQIRPIFILKAVLMAVSIVIITIFLVGVIIILVTNNDEMKPGKEYVTDYVAVHSPYAVQTRYDAQHHPRNIVVVKAKSGVSVAGTGSETADSYNISETTSSLMFTFYNRERKVINTIQFDTEKGQWVK
jgi:hypothetical protein